MAIEIIKLMVNILNISSALSLYLSLHEIRLLWPKNPQISFMFEWFCKSTIRMGLLPFFSCCHSHNENIFYNGIHWISFTGHLIKSVYRLNLINPEDEISFSNHKKRFYLQKCRNNIVISLSGLRMAYNVHFSFRSANLKFVIVARLAGEWISIVYFIPVWHNVCTRIVIYIIRSVGRSVGWLAGRMKWANGRISTKPKQRYY